jgi:hypothetical protein
MSVRGLLSRALGCQGPEEGPEVMPGLSDAQKIGSPSWTRIEPCVWRPILNFKGCCSEFGSLD